LIDAAVYKAAHSASNRITIDTGTYLVPRPAVGFREKIIAEAALNG
jgi:hypothetical protein